MARSGYLTKFLLWNILETYFLSTITMDILVAILLLYCRAWLPKNVTFRRTFYVQSGIWMSCLFCSATIIHVQKRGLGYVFEVKRYSKSSILAQSSSFISSLNHTDCTEFSDTLTILLLIHIVPGRSFKFQLLSLQS